MTPNQSHFESVEEELKFMADASDSDGDIEQSLMYMRYLGRIRQLSAENAELERVVKDVRWRVADTTDQLQAYSHNGDRLYGLDEWSVPIRNLNIAISMLEKATQ